MFYMSTDVDGETIIFYLYRGRASIRVYTDGGILNGSDAIDRASEILPINCWPQFAGHLFNSGINLQERLF